MSFVEFNQLNNVNVDLNPGQTVIVYSGESPCNYDLPQNKEPLYMELNDFKSHSQISLFLCILHDLGITDVSMAVSKKKILLQNYIMKSDGSIREESIDLFARMMGYEEATYYKPYEGKYLEVRGYYLGGVIHYVIYDSETDMILFNPSKKEENKPSQLMNHRTKIFFVKKDN